MRRRSYKRKIYKLFGIKPVSLKKQLGIKPISLTKFLGIKPIRIKYRKPKLTIKKFFKWIQS